MKKMLFLLIFSLLIAVPAMAQSPYQNSSEEATDFGTYWMGNKYTREYTPSYKLGRGLTNTFLGWAEIFIQPRELINRDRRWPQAIFEGAARGVVFGLGRTAVGLYEVITFPFEIPKGYVPIIYPETPIPTQRDNDRHFYPHPR
jgi:putative exosortase-associated protein (TIGR04073 family)